MNLQQKIRRITPVIIKPNRFVFWPLRLLAVGVNLSPDCGRQTLGRGTPSQSYGADCGIRAAAEQVDHDVGGVQSRGGVFGL